MAVVMKRTDRPRRPVYSHLILLTGYIVTLPLPGSNSARQHQREIRCAHAAGTMLIQPELCQERLGRSRR